MEKVKVKKSTLIAALVENRAQHLEMYNEAFEGFKQEALKVTRKTLREMNTAKSPKEIKMYLDLTPPVNNLKDYDRAIGMLDMSIEDEVYISSKEYQQYVQDDWGWKESFLTSNTKYLGKRR